jgi:hypothetical protein
VQKVAHPPDEFCDVPTDRGRGGVRPAGELELEVAGDVVTAAERSW